MPEAEAAALTVTVAEAVLAVLAALVAFTVTVAGEGAVAGAVYKPVEEMVPQLEPLQPEPETDQETEVFEEPLTLEANCCVAPAVTEALVGLTPIVIGAMPVPVKATLVAEPVELLLAIESWPEALPAAVGANCRAIVSDDPGLRVAGSVGWVILKPEPDTLAALIVNAPVPDEVSVTVCDVDEPVVTLPNAMLLALAPILGVVAGATAFSCRYVVADVLLALLVTIADWAELTEAAVALNHMLVAPEGTVTEAGTAKALLLLDKLTLTPPLGAAEDRNTVQGSMSAPVTCHHSQPTKVTFGAVAPKRDGTRDKHKAKARPVRNRFRP